MTGYVADLSWKSGVRDWKVRSTKVDAGDFKHELLNRLRSTMAVNVLKCTQTIECRDTKFILAVLKIPQPIKKI